MLKKWYLWAFLAVFLAVVMAGCSAAAGPEPASAAPEPDVSASGSEAPSLPQPAEEPAAITVRYVAGTAVFVRAGAEHPLATGTLLYEGDAVKTDADAMAVLKLDADKQVQIAPDSHVEIMGFERGDAGDKTLLLLHRGNIINILDAPLGEADSYEVETPALVMAIRGTIASASSDVEAGRDYVLLFEGRSVVTAKESGDVANVAAGEYAGQIEERFEHGAFTSAELNPNEYWFLHEADYPALFDEGTAKIAERLKPMLPEADAPTGAESAGQGSAGNSAPETATPTPASPQTGVVSSPGATPQADGGSPANEAPRPPTSTALPAGDAPAKETPAAPETPAAEATPPAADTPAAPPPAPAPEPPTENAPAPNDGAGSGMDDAAFQAVAQEFQQAQQDYNAGRISKDAFLAVKQRYLDAKRQYYGE